MISGLEEIGSGELWTQIPFKTYDEMMDTLEELKDIVSKNPKYVLRPRILPQADESFILDIKIHILCLN
jgi:hypothetical protein